VKRQRLSTRDRARCFDDEGGICHICGQKIMAGERWEVSHEIPLAAGGDDTPDNRKPAHYRCHRTQTADIDAPLIAKTRRQHQKHIGAFRTSRPMPGSRASGWRKPFNRPPERRLS
jgi:5-methylcytosine-specific restriction endonuclease McrA